MLPRLALCALLGCTSTVPPRPPPSPPGPPPTFVLALGIERGEIGVTLHSACDGTLGGAIEIERPDGARERIPVEATPVAEQACIAGLGGGSTCTPRFLPWVALAGSEGLTAPGVYIVRGDQLALSCAPRRTRVTPVRAFVATGGDAIALPEGAAVPAVVAAAPPPPARDTALDIRARMSAAQHRATGRVEALLVPQHPIARGARDWTTKWGTLHLPPRAPAAIIDDERGPSWVESRATPSDPPAPLILDGKPHLVALDLEDGVTGQGPPEALRAGQSGGVIASSSRIIDGTLDVAKTLDDGLARWTAHVASQSATIDADLVAKLDAQLGAERARYTVTTSASTEYRPSWSPKTKQLVVRYLGRRVREARARKAHTVRECPPNRPASACRDLQIHARAVATATFAIEVTYDARGAVIREQAPPAVFDVIAD